jgi:hypothetical protein
MKINGLDNGFFNLIYIEKKLFRKNWNFLSIWTYI